MCKVFLFCFFCLLSVEVFSASLPSSYIDDGQQDKNSSKGKVKSDDTKQSSPAGKSASSDQSVKKQSESPATNTPQPVTVGAGSKSLPAPQQIKPAYQITAGSLIIEMSPVITTPVPRDKLTLTMLIKNEGTAPASLLFYGSPALVDEVGKKHGMWEWSGVPILTQYYMDAVYSRLLAQNSTVVVYPGAPIKIVSQYASEFDKNIGHEFSFSVNLGVSIDRVVKTYTISAPSLPFVIR